MDFNCFSAAGNKSDAPLSELHLIRASQKCVSLLIMIV
jgi:hypothetical protein